MPGQSGPMGHQIDGGYAAREFVFLKPKFRQVAREPVQIPIRHHFEGGAHMRERIDPATDAAVYYQWGSSDTDADMLRSAGDWTGDGVDEMIVYHASGTGEISIFSSEIQSGDYLRGEAIVASMVGSSADGNASVGSGLAPMSEDIDGDGDDDLVIGDPGFNTNAGRVYIFTNPLVE